MDKPVIKMLGEREHEICSRHPGKSAIAQVIEQRRMGEDGYRIYRRFACELCVQRARKTPSSNYVKAVCGCDRIIRASPTTLFEAPVLCGRCKTPFEEQA